MLVRMQKTLKAWSLMHHLPSFLLVYPLSLMSVFCFLTLPRLLTPKPEDKGMNHYSFTFESILTSYYMLNFGLKIQK